MANSVPAAEYGSRYGISESTVVRDIQADLLIGYEKDEAWFVGEPESIRAERSAATIRARNENRLARVAGLVMLCAGLITVVWGIFLFSLVMICSGLVGMALSQVVIGTTDTAYNRRKIFSLFRSKRPRIT